MEHHNELSQEEYEQVRHYESGNSFFKSGNFNAALEEYKLGLNFLIGSRGSNEILNCKLKLNISQCYLMLRDFDVSSLRFEKILIDLNE